MAVRTAEEWQTVVMQMKGKLQGLDGLYSGATMNSLETRTASIDVAVVTLGATTSEIIEE